jgi:hypothetical protein
MPGPRTRSPTAARATYELIPRSHQPADEPHSLVPFELRVPVAVPVFAALCLRGGSGLDKPSPLLIVHPSGWLESTPIEQLHLP